MALFSYKRYYKPGKGVEKDAPQKNALFHFFELYGRKFWRFLQVNILYFLVLLPIILTVYSETYDTLYTVLEKAGYSGSYATLNAGNLTVTAKDPGANGNDYTLDIDQNKNGNFTVKLYTDRGAAANDESNTVDTWFELNDITSADDLAAYENPYVTFMGAGDLEEVHGEHLSGGDGIITLFTPILYLAMLYYNYVPVFIQVLLLIASVLAYGPMKCGITYVLRNYSRESHSWISDIWDKAKENWKQGMLFGVLDCIVAALFVFNITFSPTGDIANLMHVVKYITIIAVMYYVFMRKYFYLMIVTVNLNTKSIIQNSWLLAFIGIFRNLFSGLANLLIWIGAYLLIMAVHPILEILLLCIFIFSFTNFLSISACYPLVDKYLVQPIQEMLAAQSEVNAESPAPDSVDLDENSPE